MLGARAKYVIERPMEVVVGIGEVIRRLREERDWTQYRLAKNANVSPSYIHTLEAGKHPFPSAESVRKIAGALGVPMHELMGESEEGSLAAGTYTDRESEAYIVIRAILLDVVELGTHVDDIGALIHMWAALTSAQSTAVADLITTMFARSRLDEGGGGQWAAAAYGPPPGPPFRLEEEDITRMFRQIGTAPSPQPQPPPLDG